MPATTLKLLTILTVTFALIVGTQACTGEASCATDAECTAGFHCNLAASKCVQLCTQDGHCTGGTCDLDKGKCQQTVCTPQAQKKCRDGHMYWLDSCGTQGEKAEDCSTRGCNQTGCIAATPPKPVCGDNKCDVSEGCGTCAKDCPCGQGQVCDSATNNCKEAPNLCGNKTCDKDKGESCATCYQDCECKGDEVCNTSAKQCVPRNQACNKDGKCEPEKGETCETCANDCKCQGPQKCEKGACIEPTTCGNGTCETAKGETCASCAKDCGCKNTEECINDVCQATKKCNNNGTCDAADGEDCSNCAADCKCTAGQECKEAKCIQTVSCGDGTCTAGKENCTNCASDCACKTNEKCEAGTCRPFSPCGNGVCEPSKSENCSTCAKDCPCSGGGTCTAGACQGSCGNSRCDTSNGENCASCPKDCKCTSGRACSAGQCKALCPAGVINVYRCQTGTNKRRLCGTRTGYKLKEETCSKGCHKTAFSKDDVCCTCKAGEKRCNGDDLEECDSSCTKWNKVEACKREDNRFCGSFSKKCLCFTFNACNTPGSYRCSGKERQYCSSGRHCKYWKKSSFQCSGSTPVCDKGKCCVCKPGQKRCNGFFLEECKADCTGYTTAKFCAPPQYCSNLKCQ